MSTRHNVEGRVDCDLGVVIDMSSGGVQLGFPGPVPVRVGDVVTMSLRTPGSRRRLRLSARTAWVADGVYGRAGFAFLDLKEADGDAIQRMIASATARAAG